ncbi:hypothetical protein [Fimbriiglobus ruber]|uniref:hypothetical protein n=1 Tax=Fimbriiglobus ruber TaxID=1908690 RepID=UPI00117A67F9|nr:hypothetical protein [Fimbriiglobus ruber]
MEIGPVERRQTFPHSVSPGGTAIVQVTIGPPLDGQHATFEIVGESANNGSATIVGNPTLSASGTIEILGGQQTAPGHGGGLVIRGLVNGNAVASSLPFSVCAHPDAIEYAYVGDINDDPHRVGIRLTVTAVSDSGNNAHLSEVREREIVSENFGHSPALQGAPAAKPDQDKEYHYATAIPDDRHTAGRTQAHALNHHRLHGQPGSWFNDQVDVFTCPRCGLTVPKVIRGSGYRLRRTIQVVGGQLQVAFFKEPHPALVEGHQAQPGPAPQINQAVDVPPLNGPIPPLP